MSEARVLGREVSYDVRIDPPDLVVTADLRPGCTSSSPTLLDNASRHSPAGGG